MRSKPDALREQDFDTLRDSLTEAAKLDVVSAMEILGDLLRERDPKASFDWLCAAADRGSAPAISEVGLHFSNGRGVARDFVKAAQWFEWARQAGDVSGGRLLAECYLFGKGVRKNEAMAVNLLKEAVAADDPPAMDQLGNCYHKGIGVARDDREAFRLFKAAANLNYLDSVGNLGVIYLTSPETDLGTDKALRTQEAVELFHEGAQQNNAFCMYLYARCFEEGCFEEGRGVKRNPSEARDWYRRAAEAGNPAAQEWCRKYNITLTTDQVP
jgi:TPR repeat protein